MEQVLLSASQEREQKIASIIFEAREIALQKMAEADDLADYLLWHRAVLWLNPKSSRWMFDYGDLTVEEVLSNFTNEASLLENKSEAVELNKLRVMLAALPEKTDKVRVAIKRVRTKGVVSYRVLAIFPRGVKVREPVADMGESFFSNREQDSIYFQPSVACVSHACDVLYKNHREELEDKTMKCVFYLENISLWQAQRRLVADEDGVAEFVLKKTEDDRKTQDKEAYLLTALLGGFSNEILRTRVSDYWLNRQNETVTK